MVCLVPVGRVLIDAQYKTIARRDPICLSHTPMSVTSYRSRTRRATGNKIRMAAFMPSRSGVLRPTPTP